MSFTEKIDFKTGPNKLESHISAEIQAYLGAIGFKYWRNNTGVGKFKNADDGRERKVRFGKVGHSDIFAIEKGTGRFIAIEVKRPGNKATPAQEQFLEEIKAEGAIGILAYSSRDVRDALGRKDFIF